MNKVCMQPRLNANEERVAFVVKKEETYMLMLHDLTQKSTVEVATATVNFESLAWGPQDELYFMQDGKLVKWKEASNEVQVLTDCQHLECFEHGVAFLQGSSVFMLEIAGEQQPQLVVEDVEKLFAASEALKVVQQHGQVIIVEDGPLLELALNFEPQTATISMDGQYIAFFGEQFGNTQLFIYDKTMNIVQNITEMLGETIGNTLTKLPVEHLLTPTWTETNAFYFVVTANDEARLYYGDLYGTLLPASPENERIYDYAVAQSGNWAVTAVETLEQESCLVYLDITTGEQHIIYQ